MSAVAQRLFCMFLAKLVPLRLLSYRELISPLVGPLYPEQKGLQKP